MCLNFQVLLFSQMTRMLDILMDYCQLRDFNFSRLDGSMSYSEREKNVRLQLKTFLIFEVMFKIMIIRND